MKSKLLLIGFALTSLSVTAQRQSVNLNKSAFINSRQLVNLNRENSSATLQKAQQHFPGMKVKVDNISGSFTDIFGLAIPSPGSTYEEKVQICFSQKLSAFGVNPSEWTLVRNFHAPHATFITYQQSINNRRVVFSRLNFRFTKDGRLERLQMKNFGAPAAGLAPVLSEEDAKHAAIQDISGISISESSVNSNWVWFPIPSSQGYKLRPAYAFNIKGQGEMLPVDLNGYIDAITGEVLYRSNAVKETVDLTVKGNVYTQNALSPATTEPLANLAMTINGTTYYTDSAGYFSDAVLAAPIVATVSLEGKWAKVRAAASANVTPSYVDNIIVLGGTSVFPVLSPSSDRHVNAYYHVDKVHDFMKSFFPAFTSMDNPLQTNIDVSGSCNAFYNGTSINFFPQGGGCNATSLCPDVIYHEYGHGISGRFYSWQGQGGMDNGALNEGNSDVWGMSITHDPQLGKGFYTGGAPLRRYDLAPMVYPQDITGEVHNDGEIIAGIWWDVAVNLNSPDTMTQLFAATYFDLPDGPDGTEGDVYHQVLISALLNDDIDNNLSNGTPHFTQIVDAFARHGIFLLSDAIVTHSEIAHPPANAPVTINAALAVSTPAFLQGVKLFYRVRGTQWDSLNMVDNGGFNYSAQIPAQPAATIIDYYFAIYDFLSVRNAFSPIGYIPGAGSTSITIPFQFAFGVDPKSGTDFESTLTGWTIGNVSGDNASTSGVWIQAKPVGSFVSSGTLPCQPDMDHTTGTTGKCLVTGNASSTSSTANTADVDGPSSTLSGRTSVITPVFDISNFTEPIVEYYRWYSNDRGSNPGLDYWQVMIKDSAASSWVFFVERTKKSDYAWRRRIFNVREYLPATTKFMMKFIAEDLSPGSTVEAAIDDFFLYDNAVINGIDNVSLSKASIFPNPANDEIFVTVPGSLQGMISLFDMAGKEIIMHEMKDGIKEYKLSTRAVAAGNYFLIIKTARSVQSNKVSVIH
jgi:hypothetical protein